MCMRRAPERPPHADLAAALEHGDHHHVGDPDAADDEGHGPEREQQVAQRRVGGGPRLEGVRRPRHVDLVRRLRVGSTGEHGAHGLDLVGRGAHEQRRRRRGGVEQLGGDRVADQRRGVELGRERRRLEDADHGEPLAAEPHPRVGVEVCGCRGVGRRRRRARRSAGARTRRRGTGRRRARADGVERARGRRRRHGSRRSSSSSMRSVRRTVASTPVIPAVDRDRADALGDVARRLRQRRRVAEHGLARLHPQQVGAEGVELGERSARLDAEMPTTATIAAMPMAIPSAVSSVRSRRERSPTVPTRARSTGRSRLTQVGARILMPRPASSSTTAPSRSDTRRGARAAISRSWVISTIVRPVACRSTSSVDDRRRRCGCRGCRSARRRGRSPGRRRARGRCRPAGARRRTARRGGGRALGAEADGVERRRGAAQPFAAARRRRRAARRRRSRAR